MSWYAGRVSEHEPVEYPAHLACSRECRLVPRQRLHVCGQNSGFCVPAFSSVHRTSRFKDARAVARRLHPVRACAYRGTDYDISDVVVPTWFLRPRYRFG
jgi:hypothetical protein